MEQQNPQSQTQPVYIQTPALQDTTFPKYNSKISRRVGIVQIILGLIPIVLNVALIALESIAGFTSYGIWSGIFFVVAGGFGMRAAKVKNICTIMAHMVLSIWSAIITPILFTFAFYGVVLEVACETCDKSEVEEYFIVIMNIVMGICAFVELIFAIAASTLCCAVVCCGKAHH